jgi:hypothetical protein
MLQSSAPARKMSSQLVLKRGASRVSIWKDNLLNKFPLVRVHSLG